MKIDRRKTYYIVFDTETTNGFDDPIVYDFGAAVVDKQGNVYDKISYIVYETFCQMRDLMKTAYYADKIPRYEEQIKNGERKIACYATIKRKLKELCDTYNVKALIAHNARFDYRSTTRTQRYLTKSKYRYFLPYGVEIWDTLNMAHDTICQQKIYRLWAKENGYIKSNGEPRATAEILYRYISGLHDFEESHTGLEDVLIEKDIFAKCMSLHKKMKKSAF